MVCAAVGLPNEKGFGCCDSCVEERDLGINVEGGGRDGFEGGREEKVEGDGGGNPTPLGPEFEEVLALLCALEGLGGVLEPEAKGDESRPEGTPKKEEAANDGMADGGFNAGKEPPRKPPDEPACRSSTSQLLISTSATAGAIIALERATFEAVGTKSGTLSPNTASIVNPFPGFISSKGGGGVLLLLLLLLLPASGRRDPRFVRGDDIASEVYHSITISKKMTKCASFKNQNLTTDVC